MIGYLLSDPHWALVYATMFCGFTTIGAVFFALRLQRYNERRQRPRLSVEYDSSSYSDNRYLPASSAGGGPGKDRQELWVRIRVKNNSDYPARDMQLRFIASQIKNDRFRNNRPSWWFKVSNLNSISVDVPPYFTQYFDIVYLVDEVAEQKIAAFLTITRPDMLEWPQEKTRIEKMGEYTNLTVGLGYNLFFAVVGSNCNTTYFRMPLQVNEPSEQPEPSGLLTEAHFRQCVRVYPPVRIAAARAFANENTHPHI